MHEPLITLLVLLCLLLPVADWWVGGATRAACLTVGVLALLLRLAFCLRMDGCHGAPPSPALVGHRGALSIPSGDCTELIPENSLPAFSLALAHGCQGFECDLRFTADGHVVVFHDPSVAELTNWTALVSALRHSDEPRCAQLARTLAESKGRVCELSLAQIKGLTTVTSDADVTDWRRRLSTKEGLAAVVTTTDTGSYALKQVDVRRRIVSLDELCEWMSRTLCSSDSDDLVALLELKHLPEQFTSRHAATVIDTILRYPRIDVTRNLVLVSFSVRILFVLKWYMSGIYLDIDSVDC